jgi:hypothetical protein
MYAIPAWCDPLRLFASPKTHVIEPTNTQPTLHFVKGFARYPLMCSMRIFPRGKLERHQMPPLTSSGF